MCCKNFVKRIVTFILTILLGLLSTKFLRIDNSVENIQPTNKFILSQNLQEKTLSSLCSVEPPITMFVGIEPVKVTSQPKLKYTETARRNQIQGQVNLQVIFQANGKIGKIQVIHGLSDGLTEEAISAIKRIKFKPLLGHGIPRTVSGKVECNFTLN